MRTGNRFRPVWVLTAAAVALVVGAGPLVAPAPGRAADTVRGLQWYLDALKIPEAHRITKGRGVTVAVIDSGVDPTVPELRGQVLPGTGIGSATSRDGRRDDNDEVAHGTAMSGLIAARGGGPMRHLGIAPEAKILPVAIGKTFDSGDTAEGIRWAADNGADVINLSVGGGRSATREEEAAVRHALAKDVVVVASAGNRRQGDGSIISPANIPGVIAVTGLSKRGEAFPESVWGPEAVLAAPMEDIISPVPKSVSRNGYGIGSGTSDSAAIVSGVVALVRARYPDLDAANVVNRLIRTARDRGPAGRDDQFGFGAVEPVAALTRSVPAVRTHPLVTATDPASAEPTRKSAVREDDGPAVAITMKSGPAAWITGAFCLAVPIGVVILIIVLVRRSRRRPAATGPPGYPSGPPGFPPAGAPPGFPPGSAPGFPRPVAGQPGALGVGPGATPAGGPSGTTSAPSGPPGAPPPPPAAGGYQQ